MPEMLPRDGQAQEPLPRHPRFAEKPLFTAETDVTMENAVWAA